MSDMMPLNTSPLPLPLRIEDYLTLDRTGAFQEYRKTELLGGSIYFMNAQHRPHARVKSRLHLALARTIARAGLEIEALVEGSVEIPPHDVPEPDILLTDAAEGSGLVPLASVKLVIEVSDTTLDGDLGSKQALYARAGIPEYWVLDIGARELHRMSCPEGAAYLDRATHVFGSPVEAATIPGLVVDTATL